MDSKDLWKVVLAIGFTVALILHAMFPRYEWRTLAGRAVVRIDPDGKIYRYATHHSVCSFAARRSRS